MGHPERRLRSCCQKPGMGAPGWGNMCRAPTIFRPPIQLETMTLHCRCFFNGGMFILKINGINDEVLNRGTSSIVKGSAL